MMVINGFPLLFKDMLILQYHSCFRDIYIKDGAYKLLYFYTCTGSTKVITV
jgi:hypothetical protein